MRNQLYEQTLTRQGVKWSYIENVAFDDINTQKGLSMQARLEQPILEDAVEQYKDRYLAGEQAPPLILAKPGRGKYLPLDGNQRIEASKRAKRKEHDAYLVETTDQMILERICWSFNVWVNGQPLSYEDRLAHAVTFCRKYGWTAKNAGQEFGVRPPAIIREVQVQELREKCKAANIKPPHDGALHNLSPIAAIGDDLFLEAAKITSDIGATSEDALKLARDVRNARTIAAKKVAVQEFAASDLAAVRRAETKCGRSPAGRPLTRDKFARWLREGITLLTEHTDRNTLLSGGKVDQQIQRSIILEVIDRLTVLTGAGARPAEKIRKEA